MISKQTLRKILSVVLVLVLAVSAFAMTCFAEEAASDGTEQTNLDQWISILTTVGPLVLIVVVFYFLLIRPQKKQEKESQAMRNSISVGDTITTIGGITGQILQVKDDDTFILETGADKNRITIKKWAVQTKDKSSEQ